MKLAWLGLLACTLGCGGGSEDCAARAAGNYRIAVTPLAPNTCGIEAGSVVSASSVPFPDCAGTTNESADMCSSSFDKTCAAGRAIGTLDWNAAGTRADGIATWQTDACTSTLMLAISRL